MIHLSRYIGRADAADLQELVSRSDDVYLKDLARYAVAEGRETPVLASGGLNLHGKNLSEWQAEMAALLHRASDAVGAIDHWVFSWPEGEKPSTEEIERTMAIFMQSQRLDRCKGVWGYHDDTDNAHVHLAIVRIDPVTAARVTAGDGWDIDTALRAKAVIEAEFPHWIPEAGSLYAVREGQLVEQASGQVIGIASDPLSWSRRRARTVKTETGLKRDHKEIDTEALAYEEATGFMSRKRIALEIAAPIVLGAGTLDEAHAELAKQGIELRRQGSGAAFVIDGKTVKASIDRRTSRDAIEVQFGQPLTPSPYRPAAVGVRERWPDDADRREYYALRRRHDERLSEAAANVRAAIGRRAKGDAENVALQSATTAAAFPSFAAWRAGAEIPDPAAVVLGAMGFSAASVASATPIDSGRTHIKGFRATQLKGRVIYRPIGQNGGSPAFVDLGNKALVRSDRDPAAVRASLLLLASRFPDNRIAVTGDRAFKKLVLEIASAEGVALDGALGREQAKRAFRAPTPLVQNKHPKPPPAESVRTSPQALPAIEPQPARQGDRALAMLARLFHRSDWSVDDYWTRTSLSEIARSVPASPRRVHANEAPIAEPARPSVTAVDQARRAAALAAAAMSR